MYSPPLLLCQDYESLIEADHAVGVPGVCVCMCVCMCVCVCVCYFTKTEVPSACAQLLNLHEVMHGVKLLCEQQQGVSHSVPLYPGGQERADALQVLNFTLAYLMH